MSEEETKTKKLPHLKKLIALAVIAIVLFNHYEPFKVRDPGAPGFNPEKFEFRDYPTLNDTRTAFTKLFPVGTPRKFVDHLLVDEGMAIITKEYTAQPVYTFVRYDEGYNPFRRFMENNFHIALYDAKGNLINLMVWGDSYIYPNQPTKKELNDLIQRNKK